MNFVKAETNSDGQQIRKDRCTPIQLYTEKNLEKTFKPHRVTEKEDPSRTDKMLYNRLIKISNSKEYNLPTEVKDMCKQIAKSLTSQHGNYYMTDEEIKKAEQLRQQLEEEHSLEILALDTFESLDWIEKWQNNTLTKQEKSYINRYKHKYIAIFLERAKTEFKRSEEKMNWAKREIEFWSGKTMTPEQKEILFELPF